MCGIAGHYAYGREAQPVGATQLLQMRDAMAARGPDGKGVWIHQDRRIGLAHRRLSIIDLSDRAAQPMASENGSCIISFNGEIYNFRELRRALEQTGRQFKTSSDTEVLLQLYQERGADMVHELRGMFAFAIWDEPRHELFLARDPYGIKPLYFADDGRAFRFASQVKALLAGGGISTAPDPAGWSGFYLFGSIPEPYTSYRDIRALPAGAHMTVAANGIHAHKRYHSIGAVYHKARQIHGEGSSQRRDIMEQSREALLDSVRHHLVSDVPVGAFLSGGIDSGALIGLMRDAGQDDIQTVTLAFSEYQGRRDDETPLAALSARTYKTQHTQRVVTKEEFHAQLPLLLKAMDQPTIDGINTWFVSKAAHELGLKVAVSGVGGDELFGGYPSFKDIPRAMRLFKPISNMPRLARGWRTLYNKLGLDGRGINPKAAGLAELGGSYAGAYLLRRGLFMPWELETIMDADMAREGLASLRQLDLIERTIEDAPDQPFAKIATMESCLYMRNQLLRDTDWTSMAHSLEVRLPLVDHVLLSKLAAHTSNAPWQHGKTMLSAAPSRPLPAAISSKAKTGFTTPIGEWMKQLPLDESATLNAMTNPGQHWSRGWARYIHSKMIEPQQPASST